MWAETGSRWVKQRDEARAANTASEATIVELREQLEEATGKADTAKVRNDLIKQAVKDGYKRSYITDYLDTHTIEDTLEAMEEAGNDDKPAPSKGNAKLQARLDKLEAKLARQEEDATHTEQFSSAMEELSEGMSAAAKTRVTKEVAQELDLARARHQKTPNIKDAVARAIADIKLLTTSVVEEHTKANGKGSPAALAALAEKPDAAYQREVHNLSEDAKAVLEAIRSPD